MEKLQKHINSKMGTAPKRIEKLSDYLDYTIAPAVVK